MSDAETITTINGTPVKKMHTRSGPAWRWHVRDARSHGYVVHNEIQWVEDSGRWLRSHSITDSEMEGGWQTYGVHYERAYDEEEAWEIVRPILERELGGTAS